MGAEPSRSRSRKGGRPASAAGSSAPLVVRHGRTKRSPSTTSPEPSSTAAARRRRRGGGGGRRRRSAPRRRARRGGGEPARPTARSGRPPAAGPGRRRRRRTAAASPPPATAPRPGRALVDRRRGQRLQNRSRLARPWPRRSSHWSTLRSSRPRGRPGEPAQAPHRRDQPELVGERQAAPAGERAEEVERRRQRPGAKPRLAALVEPGTSSRRR